MSSRPSPPPTGPESAPPLQADWTFAAAVLLVGIWILLLINRPEFRAWNLSWLRRGWRMIRTLAVDLPSQVLHSELLRKILASRAYAMIRDYILKPALLVCLIFLITLAYGSRLGGHQVLELYLATALFLTSPPGRYTSELATDLLLRTWHDLKIHVFAAIVQWIMEIFDSLLTALDRTVYTVDEWLRFREGDNRVIQTVKLTGGVVWVFVSYIVVFVFTLLIEPQVNPVKHVPVVTVAHKLIIPSQPMLADWLASIKFGADKPYFTREQASPLVWTTIWLIPGVFGFLVWELKENWRLYAANRAKHLGPESIGDHGETMLRLLRPGIHSGTLPKAYAALGREARKAGTANDNRVQRKWEKIRHAEEAVRHFVERELLHLLEEVQFLPNASLAVGLARAATNRIDVELLRADQSDQPARLTWEDHRGLLVGSVRPGWIEQLSPDDLTTLMTALSGLFQRAGVEQMRGTFPVVIAPPVPWQAWIEFWPQPEPRDEDPVLRLWSSRSA